MWFALARIYGSADIPVLGLYEWKTERRIVGGVSYTEHHLCLIGGHRVAK